jgi:glutaminyl-tRNA synthetase
MNVMNEKNKDFIREAVEKDLASGKNEARVHTRFPPEPNGYLHIGHAKSICLNYGIAREHNGKFNLRFDDTNPSTEDQVYVDSIIEDVKWLGADWQDRLFYASDYFDKMYEYAVILIKKGKAYVCDLSLEELRDYRGTISSPGRESPFRERTVEENIDLFRRMKEGEYPDGEKTLRAKIDMKHPNLLMRDPIMYRILHASHHRTGNSWCIYPMYDWAHGLEDSIERITHSLCTLEFETHRELYDWFLRELGVFHPRQIEFARLNLGYTVLSKRKLLELVESGHVSGWDDPRMPTIAGLRRRGYTPSSIRRFCENIGVAKMNSIVEMAVLENSIKEELNRSARRVMAVLDPVKVVITNYPKDKAEELEAVNNPEDETMGKRKIPFSGEIFIEKADFMEEPPKKFFRLSPGSEVRLRYAYFIRCESVVKDSNTGEIKEIHCTYDPETRGGDAPDGRKVKGTIHWVSARECFEGTVREYDRLFTVRDPQDLEEDRGYTENFNKNSLKTIENCKMEMSLKYATPGERYQFERNGYFFADPKDSTKESPVFNRIAPLRDTWAKINTGARKA